MKLKIILFLCIFSFIYLILQNKFWNTNLFENKEDTKLENCYDVLNEEIRILKNWYTVFPEQYWLDENIKKWTKEEQINYCNKKLNEETWEN